MVNGEHLGAEIARELKQITADIRRRAFWLTGIALFVWAMIIGTTYWITNDLDKTNKIATIAAYFVLFGWGTGFIWAYFLRMEKKQDMGLRLMIQTSNTFEDARQKIEPLVQDVTGMSEKVQSVVNDVADVVGKVRISVDKYEKMAGGDTLRGAAEELKRVIGENGVVGRLEGHLATIAEAAATLKPIPKPPYTRR